MKIIKTQVDPLEILLFPFGTYVWISVIFIIFISTVFSLVLKDSNRRYFIFGKRNESTAYNLFVTMLGGPTNGNPNRNFSRYSYMMWVLMFLVLRNAYQSCLYHALKMDFVTPLPKTYEDIYKRGYIIWMNTFIYDYTKHLSPRFVDRIIKDDSYYINLFEKMMSTEGKIAILAPSVYAGYYRRTHIEKSDNLFLMNEIFHLQQLTIFMGKNFFMQDVIDKTVLEYINNGFMEKWESINLDRGNYKRKPPATKRMTMNEAIGALLILMNGCILAFFVFLVELIVFRYKFDRKQPKRKPRISISFF